ncbi:MAG: protoporphyrinogen oxidase HemJ [Parvibaculales bacterium]
MRDFLADIYPWLLAAHIIVVMFWMAGMYYLPRLFVYHAEAMEKGEPHAVFETMEANLLRIIMKPGMIVAWILGLSLIARAGFLDGAGGWLHAKLSLVVILSAYHGFLAAERKKFLLGTAPRSSRFYRMINEIPPILTIFIVILVVVQPF